MLRWRPRLSFRRRITLAAAAAVAAAILLASGLTFLLVASEMRGQVDDSLEETAGELAGDRLVFSPDVAEGDGPATDTHRRLARPGSRAPRVLPAPEAGRSPAPAHVEEPPAVVEPTRETFLGPAELELLPAPEIKRRLVFPAPPLGGNLRYAQLVRADGEVIRPPGSEVSLPDERRAALIADRGSGSFFTNGEVGGVPVRVFTRATQGKAALQVARPVDEVEDALRRLAGVLALVSLGGVGLGAMLALVVTRTTLKPVTDLSEAAEHVARTRDLSRRIDTTSSDELGRLALSFNTMLGALERSMLQQRQLVADASHELRTPLTSLRTNIEVLAESDGMPGAERQRLLRDVVGQLEELSILVGDLVDLAREAEDEPFATDLRLDRLVFAAVERARRRHPEREFRLETEPTLARGVAARLDRAIANLIDNAEKWSPADRPIEIAVTQGEVTVRDHGPGIRDEDLPFVFDRFYRASTARSMPGSGLGLAIVRHVAETHGGRVAAEKAQGGGGLLRLCLPALEPPAEIDGNCRQG